MSLAIGIDMGGTYIRAALVDTASEAPHLQHEERIEVGEDHAPERLASLVAAVVEGLRRKPGCENVAVGIGFAGMLRGSTGVVANAPNFGWRDVDFRGLLRARIGPAVDLYNDLNAIAWGEHRYGAGRGAPNMLCVFFGTGIGGGIVIDGRIYIGADHLAGEIGHTKVVWGKAARPCGCGQRGCIEAYAGGRNLAARVRADAAAGKAARVLALARNEVDEIHAGHVDQAAREGDGYARRLWSEVAPLVGMTLANAVTLLNPNRLVLGGGVWEGAPELRRASLDAYGVLVNAPTNERLVVCATRLGDIAGILGAASLAAAASTGLSPPRSPNEGNIGDTFG